MSVLIILIALWVVGPFLFFLGHGLGYRKGQRDVSAEAGRLTAEAWESGFDDGWIDGIAAQHKASIR